MSWIRFLKRATASAPAANNARQQYATAGEGFNTPAAFEIIDEAGVRTVLGLPGTLSYRFIKVTLITAAGAGTWTPANGCKLAVVECVGGGGQGGGAATSSATASVGGGGGGGAYAAKTLTGAAIKSTSYSVGAKGSTGTAGNVGQAGGDTTWDTSVIVAKGGSGGAVLAAAATVGEQVGAAGGTAAGSTGDMKLDGGVGGTGTRASGTSAISGEGGSAPMFGPMSAGLRNAVTGGVAGVAATAGSYGSGGGGGATLSTSSAGGAGNNGCIRITEYA